MGRSGAFLSCLDMSGAPIPASSKDKRGLDSSLLVTEQTKERASGAVDMFDDWRLPRGDRCSMVQVDHSDLYVVIDESVVDESPLVDGCDLQTSRYLLLQ